MQRGPTLDGFGEFYRQVAEESPAEPVDVAQVLRDTKADVLVSYLPVGSEDAQRYYAQACLDAGVAFVNAIPVFIASDPEWAEKFRAAGLPIVGDDIKSQVGATIVHRTLARLFEDRGTTIDHTYQLNFGGNMDFMNMLERKRLKSKKISKTQSVTSQIDQGISDRDVHIGPSDHVPWLDDRKWALIRLEGRNFGDVPAHGRAQARGARLAELRRRDHRRRPLRQDRPRPRHGRPARGPQRLLHEEPGQAVPRRGGPPPRRGLRPRRRRPQASGAHPTSEPVGERVATTAVRARGRVRWRRGRPRPRGGR